MKLVIQIYPSIARAVLIFPAIAIMKRGFGEQAKVNKRLAVSVVIKPSSRNSFIYLAFPGDPDTNEINKRRMELDLNIVYKKEPNP